MADPLDGSLPRGEIERTTRAHRHPAHIRPLLAALRHDRPHEVARLETVHSLRLFGPGTWEAEPVHATHLSRTVPRCLDVQGPHAFHRQGKRRAAPHARPSQPITL